MAYEHDIFRIMLDEVRRTVKKTELGKRKSMRTFGMERGLY